MPQPTVGYGKFYYGRALYGQMQIASGQITDSWSTSSTIKGELKAAGGLASASVWTWTSTAIAHPIDAGRVSSSWAWSETAHGFLKAGGRYATPTWHWTDMITGSLDVGTLIPQHWTWTDILQGHISVIGKLTVTWTWSTTVVGYNFWQPVGADPAVDWTPVTPGSDIWTPVVH